VGHQADHIEFLSMRAPPRR